MFIGMCPEGSEGASYAMLTTLSNASGSSHFFFFVTNDNFIIWYYLSRHAAENSQVFVLKLLQNILIVINTIIII